MFGKGLQQVLAKTEQAIPLTHRDLDITRADQVMRKFAELEPDVVVHAAALPDIDYCEMHPEEAHLVNAVGTRNVVAAAASIGAAVAHISTDAVFDGAKRSPYVETDATNPISVYGRSKLEAERAVQEYDRHFIFRVSVLFGPGKANFVSKTLRAVVAGEIYRVASDQLGSATYTLDAAQKILEVVKARAYGLYHLCNFGQCSRLDLAEQAVADARLDRSKIEAIPGSSMGRPGPRVKYAVMEMKALRDRGFALPRPWQEALREYLRHEGVH